MRNTLKMVFAASALVVPALLFGGAAAQDARGVLAAADKATGASKVNSIQYTGTGWIAFAHVVLSTSYDIYTVQNAARHEAGHVLGLGHSPETRDIMAAATEGRQYQLTEADRATAGWLYRLPPGKLP